jgi:exopolysaccharide biosynthesis polyprenyl glycosylphosphotransferase
LIIIPELNLHIIASIAALITAFIVTPRIRSLALRYRIGDYPDARKIHTKFIPRMGGLGIIIGTVVSFTLTAAIDPFILDSASFNLWGVALGLLMIILLGVYDDIKGVGSFGKLFIQFIAASIVISSGLQIEFLSLPFVGSVPVGLLNLPLTLLWIVGITNAFNLLDGLDGLAVGVAAIVAATFLYLGVYYGDAMLTVTSLSLFFACIGFLFYNFHPATIFMGDTGSLFLGFLLACISLEVLRMPTATEFHISSLVVVITLAVPLVDTSVAFFRRIKKGMHPLKADKEHIHHRLMDLGLTHRQTVVIHYAIAGLSGVIALSIIFVDHLYAVILTLVVAGAVFFSIRRLGYLEEMTAKTGTSKQIIQPLSIAKIIDKAILILADGIALLLSFYITYWFRFQSGFLTPEGNIPLEIYFRSPALLLLGLFWIITFILAGLYEIPWDLSRIDYGISVLKSVAAGTFLLFLITFDLESATLRGRLTTLIYGASVFFCVAAMRMFIVGIERKYEILGYRRRNTLLVGASHTTSELLQEISRRPELKYKVLGIVDHQLNASTFGTLPVLGNYNDIPSLVKQHNIEEVIITKTQDAREDILQVITVCNGMISNVKVIPDDFDTLSGFKTEEIIGHPLIRLYPTNMKRWQWIVKRLIDLVVSLVVLIPFMPLWLCIATLIVLDSPGSIFFIQERVGKNGKMFKLLKFRSMIADAEKETGPVWAAPDDKRITRFGRIFRRLRLDEVPQFINVLKGEMSLVGPRPERPFFVQQLEKEVKFYNRRLVVRPGITGWAQVKHRYDVSLDDVKEKIRYDLYYLENMSLTLDLKIILRTILVALSGKGTH